MRTVNSLLITAFLATFLRFSEATSFDYSDPSTWSSTYPVCAGNQQSPIDLLTSVTSETTHDQFTIEHHADSITANMTNTGHSLKVDVGHSVRISGGGLEGSYTVDQFHYHWGSNSSVGSEHTIDGHHYPMELHVVSHNSSYASFTDAKNHSDGLAVFAFLYQIQTANNSHLDSLLSHISDVHNLDDHHEVTYTMDDVMESSAMTSYYRYHGSLTTPECYESVLWTVFDHTIGVSELQMEDFRSVFSDNGTDHLVDNFRPVQTLHGRTVHKYSYTASGGSGLVVARPVYGILAICLFLFTISK